MVPSILQKPLTQRKSFFLFGPRGTGKTHWIKTNLKKEVYIDLLDTHTYRHLLANPHHILVYIPKNYKSGLVIDEVQRIPALLNEVHRLIERERHIFILTGSSAHSLRKKGVNLLGGRALVYYMHPLVIQELGEKFDLKKALQYGLLPSIFLEPSPKSYLQSYVGSYLREEVLQEGLTRNFAGFSHFLETASFSQGQVLNKTAVAREVSITQKSVSNYFDILEDLLLAHRLPIFTKRAKRKSIQHPKFYFFDVGIYHTLRPQGVIDTQAQIEGMAL